MAAPPNSKKTAKAGVKKIPIAKTGIKKAAKKIVLKTPATPAKPRSVTSMTKPAAVKKASPLRKVGSKVIKKTTTKKAKQVSKSRSSYMRGRYIDQGLQHYRSIIHTIIKHCDNNPL